MKLIAMMAVILFVLTAYGADSTTARRTAGQSPLGVMLPSLVVRSSQGMQVAKALGGLFPAFLHAAGVENVNFHWYIADTGRLRELWLI